MKKLTKILSVIMAMLILNNNVYAAEGGILSEISIEIGGWGKIVAMAGTIIVIAIIIYTAYRTDKKDEVNTENFVEENDYYYEESSVMEGTSLLDEEDNVSMSELVETTEYEEESLYNTANNYIENTQSHSMLDEDEIEESKEVLDDNEVGTFENDDEEMFSLDTNQEENEFESKSETLFEEKDEIGTDKTIEENFNTVGSEEDFSFDTIDDVEETILPTFINTNDGLDDSFETESIQEENNKIEKKRFTRKKEVAKEEIDVLDLENDFEEDFEEDDDDTPTFDELLKKSEEEAEEEFESFNFMAEMEENLKKDQVKRQQKSTTKKTTSKTKKSDSKTTTKKVGTKKKKNNEE